MQNRVEDAQRGSATEPLAAAEGRQALSFCAGCILRQDNLIECGAVWRAAECPVVLTTRHYGLTGRG